MFCIVSKNFHPAHSYSINCILRKFPDCYLDVDDRYTPYLDRDVNGSRLSSHHEHRLAVFINPDKKLPLDLILRRLRRRRSVVWIHEPEKNPIRRLRHAGGWLGVTRLIILIMFNYLCFLFADKLVVFSNNGFSNLPDFARSKCVVSSLPFIDLAQGYELDKFEKQQTVIAYIGTVASDHAFEEFCTWVKQSKLTSVTFKVYTRSKVCDRLIDQLGDSLQWSGEDMSSDYIALAYADADFIWCNYKVANQSGVLPMALMWSATPLVSNAFGEDIRTLKSGVVTVSGYDPVKLDSVLAAAIPNKGELAESSRSSFLKLYDISNRSLREICYA